MQSQIISLLMEGITIQQAQFKRIELHENRGKYPKTRIVHKPDEQTRELHSRLRELIRSMTDFPESAHCGVPERSPQTNVAPHLGSKYFLNTDLVDAYGNVDAKTLASITRKLVGDESKWWREWEIFTSRYFIDPIRGGIYLGSPASPDLFNHYCNELVDKPIRRLLKQPRFREIAYTRYGDDLTLSSKMSFGRPFRKHIREIIAEAGFAVNHRKTTHCNLKVAGQITITGIRLVWEEERVRPQVPRSNLRKVSGMVHLEKEGRLDQSGTAQLKGHMANIRPTVSLLGSTRHGISELELSTIAAYLRLHPDQIRKRRRNRR